MIRVGVLTYNVIRSLRDELLARTMDSIEYAFPDSEWHLLDNGSDDGSDLGLATEGWFFHRHPSAASHSPGAGRNRLVRQMQPAWDDIVVLSDDDMCWRLGAEHALRYLWLDAPADVVLIGGLIEPEYPWSRPTGTRNIGGRLTLERPSVPAAAWSFRGRDWDKIGPLKETTEGQGEDFEACRRLSEAGLSMVAVDLADHIGQGYSQLGNDEARRLAGRPIDLASWGIH